MNTGSFTSQSDVEQIRDPARLVPLLERLAKRRTPLVVQVPGHAEQYSSCIVDVDRQFVQLDELLPASGHKMLLAERALQITGKLEGIDISFRTTLERVEDQDRRPLRLANSPVTEGCCS